MHLIRPHRAHRTEAVYCYTCPMVCVCLLGTPVSLAHTVEEIEMPCEEQMAVRIGATWRIRLNDPCARRCGIMSNYFDHLLTLN